VQNSIKYKSRAKSHFTKYYEIIANRMKIKLLISKNQLNFPKHTKFKQCDSKEAKHMPASNYCTEFFL